MRRKIYFWLPFAFAYLVILTLVLHIDTKALARWYWNVFHEPVIALVIDPKDADLSSTLGEYYFGGDRAHYDVARAEELYKHAIAIDPKNVIAHYQLARIFFIQSELKKATDEITLAQSLDPNFVRVYYMHGLILGYQGRFTDAIPYFQEFIRRVPQSWAGYNDLAWVYFAKGDFVDAAKVAADGLRVDQNNPWLLNSLGVSLMNTGDKAGAMIDLEKAKRYLAIKSPGDWGWAYPGNDPSTYAGGLMQMKNSIEQNLTLLKNSGDK